MTDLSATASSTKRHAAKRERSRGWVIVYTGDGKGKTTASLGIALRATGYNMKVCMIQFIKGSWFYGELKSCQLLAPNFRIIPAGKGFVGIIDDKKPISQHITAAREALRLSKKIISSGLYDIVILDEINYAVNLKLIGLRDVLELIRRRPTHVNLVLTGRREKESISDSNNAFRSGQEWQARQLKSEDVPSGAACKVEDLDRQGRDVRRERPAEGVEISLESGNEQPLVGETAEEGDRGREQMVLSTHNVQIVH